MLRRKFVSAVASVLVTAPFAVAAQSREKLRRIGWLHLGRTWNLWQFRDKLRALGWIEGRNIAIESRFADNEETRLPALAAELVDLDVEVIVTQTTPAAIAAKRATAIIPIVMAGSSDPVPLGLVASLGRPGGN